MFAWNIWLTAFLGLAATVTVLGFLIYVHKPSPRPPAWRIVWQAGALATLALWFALRPYPLHFAMPPFMQSFAPHGMPASLPFLNALEFAWTSGSQERVETIGADPTAVPSAIARTEATTVTLALTAKEVVSEIDEGIWYNYWTYDGTVPGPMLRVRVGDTVQLSLTNDETSLHPHTIDLHAATGPGGGAAYTSVQPGETKTVEWKALNPGLYIYHCATANVSVHNAHGQYGLILVEPEGGLEPVDREFYLVQGELYTLQSLGSRGLQIFDPQAVLDGTPTYVVFNGQIESAPRLQAEAGETIRLYVGNGGVNLISSFHVIGEIFDRVYVEGGIGAEPLQNVQTTTVLPGGSTIVEFTVDSPGTYLIVDHALARLNKGAWATLTVSGEPTPEIMRPVE